MTHNNYGYTPFEDLISGFNAFLSGVFLQISEISEKRKIRKSANLFIDLLINHSIKKDIEKVFTIDILKSMPDGIWNVETIGIVEKKLKLIFDNDFIERLRKDPQFSFKDPLKQSYFLKRIICPALGIQIGGLELLRTQVSKSSIREKDKINVRLGREIIETLDLMNKESKKILTNIKREKNIVSDEFMDIIKRYWSAYTLLFLRILDILSCYKKDVKLLIKKMDYLSVERIKAKSYF
jgi:hypothetical protein